MPIERFIRLNNVGRFRRSSSSGDVSFRRYTLIYGENGRGKTTLCAVLRSLKTGDGAFILGRRTLGSADVPVIEIRHSAGNLNFGPRGWSRTLPEIAVFDSTFVSQNVHSGDAIEPDHKRNLHKVIIGAEGVALATKIETLDSNIRSKTTELRDAKNTLQAVVPKDFTLETFIGLAGRPTGDQEITDARTKIAALKEADSLKAQQALRALAMPEAPKGLRELLERSLDGVAADALTRFRAHLGKHGDAKDLEHWLAQGLAFAEQGDCPFCGRDLDGVELVDAFKAFFSVAYGDFTKHLREELARYDRELGDRIVAEIRATFEYNHKSLEILSRFRTFVPMDFKAIAEKITCIGKLRLEIKNLLSKKISSPLDAVEFSEEFVEAISEYNACLEASAGYNDSVVNNNEALAKLQASLATADLVSAERELARLLAATKRHEPDVRDLCERFFRLGAEKDALETEKNEAKAALDAYSEAIISAFEQDINTYLDRFGADFRITGTRQTYSGRVPNSSYQIQINGVAVDLGTPDAPLDRPTFKNTLSGGDRSTLALSFFLAQLHRDPEKARRIVVFDDPFSSQDAFRRSQTATQIRRCGTIVAQVIVLSHDLGFVKLVWDGLAPEERKTLLIDRTGDDSCIREFDLVNATMGEFAANRAVLHDYNVSGTGDPADIVKRIRPVLETWCRNRCSHEFHDETLGEMVQRIEQAGAVHPLFRVVEDIRDLNEFTRERMHGEVPGAPPRPIDGTELRAFVRRALHIVRNEFEPAHEPAA